MNWLENIPPHIKVILTAGGVLLSAFSGRLPEQMQTMGALAAVVMIAAGAFALIWHRVRIVRNAPGLGFIDYSVAIVFAVIAVFAVYKLSQSLKLSSAIHQPATVAQSQSKDAQTGPASKVFVAFSPEYFVSLFKGRSQEEKVALLSLYKDKWMKVHGSVGAVYPSNYPEKTTDVMIQAGSLLLDCRFDPEQAQTASTLQRNTKVEAVGQIDMLADEFGFALNHCELSSFDPVVNGEEVGSSRKKRLSGVNCKKTDLSPAEVERCRVISALKNGTF